MPFLETLALAVAPSIGKMILRIWFQDHEVAYDVSSQTVDLIASLTSNILVQQKGYQQFQAIGLNVAESLLPLFETDGGKLNEASKTSVALAVRDSIEISDLTSKLLATMDFEPSDLAQHMRSTNPVATRDLSAQETSLYIRIIDEICEYVIDIAASLPGFTVQTFTEVLSRENDLLGIATKILEEVRSIREKAEKSDARLEAVHFETEYRRAVIRKLDFMELFGVDISSAIRRHPLSVAYIMLAVRTSTHREYISRPINEALQGYEKLLVQGDAGSGKTTLLKWIAVRAASQSFEWPLTDWNDKVPFFLPLRQTVQSGLPAPEDFPRMTVPAIAGRMPEYWVHDQLERGRGILLIDGLDEISREERRNLGSWLDDIMSTYPQNIVIVTARPTAIKDGYLISQGFSNADLQPMELGDIGSFIDHWHLAVSEVLQDPSRKSELPTFAQDLQEVIRKDRALRSLATNPLLCAMLCALHLDRNQQLPSDRIELYDACCYMLLERLDLERRVKLTDYVKLTYRQKRFLTEDLAYYLWRNGWSEIQREQAIRRLDLRLGSMNLPKEVTGEKVQILLTERSGLIREPIANHIHFTHRTFQEFLAAHQAISEGDLGLLVSQAHNDQWRDMIVLAAGIAHTDARQELIASIIQRGDNELSVRHYLYLLAVACLEVSTNLAPELQEEVTSRLHQIVPPKTMGEAKALSSAGDLAVPHLGNWAPSLEESIVLSCIQTLGFIRSDTSLNALSAYLQDERASVRTELIRSIGAFGTRYNHDQISWEGTRMTLSKIATLDGIQYLTNLTNLSLQNCDIEDIAPLAALANLTILSFYGCMRLVDLSHLGNLTNLREIYISSCTSVSDLLPLRGLKNLNKVQIWNCPKIQNIEFLKHIPNFNLLDGPQLSSHS